MTRASEHRPGETACWAPGALWGWSPTPLPAGTRLAATGRPLPTYLRGAVPGVHCRDRGPSQPGPPPGATGTPGARRDRLSGRRRLVRPQLLAVPACPLPLTGAGWLALGAMALVEVGLGHSVIAGYEQPVFLGVLVAGLGFEAAWTLWRRTYAIVPRRSAAAHGRAGEKGPSGPSHARAEQLF